MRATMGGFISHDRIEKACPNEVVFSHPCAAPGIRTVILLCRFKDAQG
jgi:hypothetical protein